MEQIARTTNLNVAPPPRLITLAPGDGVTILTLSGDIDAVSEPLLRDRLQAQFDLGRPCVVDLRDVSFIDSSILSALLAARRRNATEGLGFAIVLGEASSAVRRLLEIVMVDLQAFEDLRSASIAAVQATPPGQPSPVPRAEG
jgi:anti-sigma B factor antagonist